LETRAELRMLRISLLPITSLALQRIPHKPTNDRSLRFAEKLRKLT
jgi:hypothetical protein